VADAREAALWGQPYSCWPIGDVSYLYLRGSRLVYTTDGRQETPQVLMDEYSKLPGTVMAGQDLMHV
jgi:hypothetical protein